MKTSEKRAYWILEFAFLAVAFGAATFGSVPEISPGLFWIVLGFAAYRFGRSISYNLVFKWFRDWIGIVVVKDSSGAGESVEVENQISGGRRVLAELICCPVCSGTWGAVLFVMIVSIFPEFGRALVLAFGAAGVAEFILWIGEFFEWSGRASREVSGSFWLRKNRKKNEGGLVVIERRSENVS